MNVDSVSHAESSPEKVQPYAALGLKDNEYALIRDLLGRRPTSGELAMYSVMWSEHCSYKSSKVHLRQFGQKVTPEMTKNLLVGMGENAGVVDIGEGWAVTFKIESHNHPSFIEPFQGAATGVGGIVRDIISMGARPVAVMDALRFGDLHHPDTSRVVPGVVSGISFYANCLGLPNIGGETWFDPIYQHNPLVNALAVGVLRHEDLHLASAKGNGNKVVLFGARTGGDGIGGASILASEAFDEGGPTKRPAVQVGDPFAEKVLIECCLELFANNVVEGIQDLGAAGISCATSELAANGGSGMEISLDEVLLRDDTLTAEEILMSESQERMMAIVSPEKMKRFLDITGKWEVEASVLGEVTDTGRLIVHWRGETIVDVDPATVAIDSPEYERPYHRPEWLDALQAQSSEKLFRSSTAEDVRADILRVLGSPAVANPEWITNQYDRYVLGNTALSFPDDGGMIRVDETTGLGVALATDANARFSYLDPYRGAQLALSEAYRNVAATGAQPVAVSDCLNFGSPEDPEVMWQFVESVSGLADGCLALGIPVTGGNVSLYNQTGSTPIYPTPVVAVMGVIDTVDRRLPSGWQDDGENLYLLGSSRAELDGSLWAQMLHDHLGGMPPQPDLAAEKALAGVMVAAAHDGLVTSAHDVSTGGLAVALVEGVLRRGVGARVWLGDVMDQDGLDITQVLFSESVARMVVSVAREDDVKFQGLCRGRGVPVARIGVTDVPSHALDIADVAVLSIDELSEITRKTLPAVFGPIVGYVPS
ncbi:MAG: phosphoribosylformylglycinamidine synthase II [Pontimonas sp.]|jgi:phosphoribosylformylglycinamidine synthase II